MISQVSVCAGGAGISKGERGWWVPTPLDLRPGIPIRPLLLAPSGGHQNMYGWQVGGTHPTGMLSC